MRDLIVRLRQHCEPEVGKLSVKGISEGSQPLVLWRNRQLASRHRSYSGEVFADLRKLAEQLKGADAGLAKLCAVTGDRRRDRTAAAGALERFCAVFPARFRRLRPRAVFRPQGGRQGTAAHGRLPPDARLFPRR